MPVLSIMGEELLDEFPEIWVGNSSLTHFGGFLLKE